MIYDVEVMDEVNSSSIEEESQGCKSWSWRLVNVFFSPIFFSFLDCSFPRNKSLLQLIPFIQRDVCKSLTQLFHLAWRAN